MELHIARLSEAQRRQGVEVFQIHNVGATDGPAMRVWPCFDLDRIKPQSLRNFIFYLGAVFGAANLPRKSPTVLHVHGAWSDFLFSKVLALALDADTTFASIHGVVRPRWQWLYRLALSHCSEVFATGKAEQKFLTSALGRHVVHLPSGVARAFVEDGPSAIELPRFDVVSVGNLVPKKRFDLVVECARRRPDLRFAIVGDGPMRSELEKSISGGGLTNISILGRQRPEIVAEILRGSRLFLSTSEEEGAPTAALEAMAIGLPVVLAPANEFEWLTNRGANGLITTAWSIAEFGEKIDLLLNDEPRRREMGKRNRAQWREHTWENIAARLTGLMRARVSERVR